LSASDPAATDVYFETNIWYFVNLFIGSSIGFATPPFGQRHYVAFVADRGAVGLPIAVHGALSDCGDLGRDYRGVQN
jgi:hypothetical protein